MEKLELDWKHSLFQKLKKVNQRTDGYRILIEKYNQTIDDKMNLLTRCSNSEEEVKRLQTVNNNLEKSLLDHDELLKKAERCDFLEQELMKSLRETSLLANEIIRLNNVLEDTKKNLKTQQENSEQLSLRNKQLEEELEAKKIELSEFTKENDMLRGEFEPLQQKWNELNKKYVDIYTESSAFKSQLDVAQRTIDILEVKLSKSQNKIAEFHQADLERFSKLQQASSVATASSITPDDFDDLVLISSDDIQKLPSIEMVSSPSFNRRNSFRRLATSKIAETFKRLVNDSNPVMTDSFNRTSVICICSTKPTAQKKFWDYPKTEIYSSAFQPSGSILAIGGSDRRVHLRGISEAGDDEKLNSLRGSHAAITALEFDNEDKGLLAGCARSSVYIWSYGNSGEMRSILTGHSDIINTCKFVTGNRLCTGSDDRTVRFWDCNTPKMISKLDSKSKCQDLVITDTVNSLISGHCDKKLRIWDLRSSECQRTIDCDDPINSLFYNHQKQQLLIGFTKGPPHLMDMRQNSTITELSLENLSVSNNITKAILSPDGIYACGGSTDGSLIVWDLNNLSSADVLKSHKTRITSISWSPNGREVVTTEKQSRVIIWS